MSELALVGVLAIAIISGATASVVGFGIGSLLTPFVAREIGMSEAIAVVAIPHAVATALRCWRLRRSIDKRVLRTFGLLSAAGALGGALLYARASSQTMTLILALLLIATSVAALTDWTSRWKPHGPLVGALGFASGAFGGLAGNQGGLRAAAMLSFGLTPAAFVATQTATGLLVDAGRLPVYVWRSGSAISANASVIAVATAGVLVGTILGERVLLGLSPRTYRRVVGAAIGALGLWLLGRIY